MNKADVKKCLIKPLEEKSLISSTRNDGHAILYRTKNNLLQIGDNKGLEYLIIANNHMNFRVNLEDVFSIYTDGILIIISLMNSCILNITI